jgi:DNA-directed RNA polymerase subunit RPC12/RpoP
MTVLYTYRCAACSHRGDIRLDDDSHDDEEATCSACGATVTIEWDGGVTIERATPAVDELMADAFAPGRDPRSEEYKTGASALLEWRINGVPLIIPYEIGTAQCVRISPGRTKGK